MATGATTAWDDGPAPGASEPCPAPASPLAHQPLVFKQVYEDHFAFVWRNLLRLGVNAADMDDVVQEVFIVVYRRLVTFEPRSSLRAWIFTILTHVVRTHRRTRARKQPVSAGESHNLADLQQLGPEESLRRSEAAHMLECVLGSMPDEQREVFIMVELEQLSGPEIAEALSVSVNTVYSRLRAAREQFQRGAAGLCAQLRRQP